MKDEELFNVWKSEQYKDQFTEEKMEFVEHLHTFPKYFEKTFLAGIKAGRPQWHDLRKDPNDLPKEENRIMLCYCCIGYHGNIGTYVYRLYTKKEFHKVIAWCEIPTFDKE